MKRALLGASVLCVLALGIVAAPALSLDPYRPTPVDFSLHVPADALLGEPARRGAGIVSEPLEAPGRFNLVGLTWRDAGSEPAVAVRTRIDGREWGPWAPLFTHSEDSPDPGSGEPPPRGGSNPVWVGEGDEVQYRSSEQLPGLRLEFVNVQGTRTAADRLRSTVRGSVSAGVGTLAGLVSAPAARAGGPRPAIVPREDWGAEGCQPRERPELGEVRNAIIHHTVGANDYSRSEAPDVVLGICRYHRNTNGWNDIGYNFLVDRFGTIYEGRDGGIDRAVIGAQAQGVNAQSTGIANLGTFTTTRQTPAALAAIAKLIRWKLPLHGVATDGTTVLTSAGGESSRFSAGERVRLPKVAGHRDANATSCPGEALYAQLPELRRMVGDATPVGTATLIDAAVANRGAAVTLGQPAVIAGSLTQGTGTPVANQPVEIEARVRGRWRAISSARTAGDGAYSAELLLLRSRTLRARFLGSGDLRPALSATFGLGVRPVVTLVGSSSAAVAGERTVLEGKVTPRKKRVVQVLQRRVGARWRRVGTKTLRTLRSGTFRASFVAAGNGRYRIYIVAPQDGSTARGASPKVEVGVLRAEGGGTAAPRTRD